MVGIIKINEGFEATVEVDGHGEGQFQIVPIAEGAALGQVLKSRKVFATKVVG